MNDVTLSPAMGHWLDMVNNGKPNVSKAITPMKIMRVSSFNFSPSERRS
jgi:hypothetical protein